MNISGKDLSDWIDDISTLCAAFQRDFTERYGYPPDDHYVKVQEPGTPRPADLRSETLANFYATIFEVSLPDLDNGYFIHPAESATSDVHPTRISGAVEDSITVFGSDGGGALFALSDTKPVVYRLHGGALIGTVYDVDGSGAEEFTSSFSQFLDFLRDRLRREVL